MSERTGVLPPVVVASLLATLAGCGASGPVFAPVSGTVLLAGRPVANAEVVFMPTGEGFGPADNSYGTTDEHGRYSLKSISSDRAGAAVGSHVVLVREGPLPEELRRAPTAAVDEYRRKLGGRPLPPQHSNFSSSPLKVEVTSGQTEYDIAIDR